MSNRATKPQSSITTQLLVNFVIPLIILNKFSSDSQLGPTGGFLLALAFPLAFELYAVRRYKRINPISLIAIGGILITGGVSLLGLSEGWLAVRRSATYALLAAGILLVQIFKPKLIRYLLARMLDMEKINRAVRGRANQRNLDRAVSQTAYAMSLVFSLGALASYALTRAVISSPTNTEAFNREYASLRVLTLPAIIIPMILAVMIVALVFFYKLKKITGIEPDDLVKKV